MNKEKNFMVTGHRKMPTGRSLKKLENSILFEIQTAIIEGYETFFTGGAQGFDLLCAKLILQEIQKFSNQGKKNLKLITVVPFKAQYEKYSMENKNLYRYILEASHEVIVLSELFHKSCYKNRNQYMVDCSSKVLAYFSGNTRSGTAQTLRMAEKQSLKTTNLYTKP